MGLFWSCVCRSVVAGDPVAGCQPELHILFTKHDHKMAGSRGSSRQTRARKQDECATAPELHIHPVPGRPPGRENVGTTPPTPPGPQNECATRPRPPHHQPAPRPPARQRPPPPPHDLHATSTRKQTPAPRPLQDDTTSRYPDKEADPDGPPPTPPPQTGPLP